MCILRPFSLVDLFHVDREAVAVLDTDIAGNHVDSHRVATQQLHPSGVLARSLGRATLKLYLM